MLRKKHITGILLAGGQSTRMGTDKGLLPFGDGSFASRILEVMEAFVSEIIIVSDHTEYDSFKPKRVEDLIKFSGPMGGIHSGLTHSQTEYNIILSCDVPLINKSVLKVLLNAADPEFDIIQLKYLNHAIPLIGLYNKRCLGLCEQLLNMGERRLSSLIEKSKQKTIELGPELGPFTANINTPQQLNKLKNAFEY